jgi:predicted DsbA family dithiol-disulfide isomerase
MRRRVLIFYVTYSENPDVEEFTTTAGATARRSRRLEQSPWSSTSDSDGNRVRSQSNPIERLVVAFIFRLIPSKAHTPDERTSLLRSILSFTPPSSLNMSASLHKVVDVKIVSDIVCPFCFVGLRNLQKASAAAGIDVNLEWEPFLLNPNLPDQGEGLKEHISKKYGPQAISNFGDPDSHLGRVGREAGINFTFDRNIYPTVRAHSLIEFVKKTKDNITANAIMEELYQRYFEQGQNINDVQLLTEVAAQFGIDKNQAVQAISDPELHAHVREKDQTYKRNSGISGVPYFMMERHDGGKAIAVSGAQPPDVIAAQLQKAVRDA